ncbi:MAG TPA: hypothetical protein VJ464_12810 [Blastocatellia bacterium]|nr:hypothetical protein [Blastocatellia bacterium]
MNWDRLKKIVAGAALILTLWLGSGIILPTTAQAQFRGRGRYDRRDSDRREEVAKGYRDGLDRGEEDARDRRRYDPNNSEHYRRGNNAYRDGFRRGYADGYRRNRHRR